MGSKKSAGATRLAQTLPLADLPRSAFFRAYRIDAGTLVEPHSHHWCQFAFARRGIMHVRLSDSTMVVPPQYGMWVPANTPHSVWAPEHVDLESIYIRAPHIVSGITRCRVVVVTDLVREFIHHACKAIAEDYDESGRDGLKVQVLLDFLTELPNAPLNLPIPEDANLFSMCEQIQADPADSRGISEWASELNVSERTLARHFQKETGMSLHAWKQRLRLLRSLEMLKHGTSVTSVAIDLGYSSTSAFIFAFRSLFGRPPKQFYATSRDDRAV